MTTSKQVKRLGKDTMLYGMGTAVQGLIVFLLFPIYTRILTQEDFGSQDLVLTAVTIVTYFLILGLDSGTARYYYDAEGPQEKRAVLSTWLCFELLVSIPVTALLILFAEPISDILFNNVGLAPVFRLGIATIPIAIIARVFTLSLRLAFEAVRFSIVIISGALVQALVAIGLVVVYGMGTEGVFLAMIASNGVQLLLGLALTRDSFGLALSPRLLRLMLTFGVPLVPASLSLWVLNYSNRYFLNNYGTLVDVAVMGVGMRVSSTMTFLISSFQNAWPPFAYSLLKDESLAKRTFSRVLTYFLLATVSMAVGLSVFAREATTILATNKYDASIVLIPWLVFSTIAWGAVGIVGIGFEIGKKSYHFSIATVVGSVLTISMNLFLIPLMGVTGAAISTLSGNLVALCYSYFAGKKYFPVSYESRKIWTLVLMAVLCSAVGVFVDQTGIMMGLVLWIVKSAIVGLFLLSVVLLKVVSWDEIRQVIAQARGRFAPPVTRELVE